MMDHGQHGMKSSFVECSKTRLGQDQMNLNL